MDTTQALTQTELEDAWSEIGLRCAAVEGELGHWTLRFYDEGSVSVAALIVRHGGTTVEFRNFEVYRPGLRLSGLVSSRLPKFYLAHGFETARIPRAKGEAAELFERIGYEPDGQGGLSAPLSALSQRANTYLEGAE